jgi:hypothetical protein
MRPETRVRTIRPGMNRSAGRGRAEFLEARMAGFRPRIGLTRLVTAALILGGAMIVSTGAMAGPGTSTTTPFAFVGTNPCAAGEAFTGTGQLHFLITDNLSNSGMFQFHIEANLSGLQAVTVLGKKYVVVSQEDQTDTFDSDGMPAHETLEHTLQFIRQGEDGTLFPDDDFYEHFLAHITANANGTVTVNDLTIDTRCR